jgi:hypothetical protein
MKLGKYSEQVKQWPKSGKYIMAQYDEEHIVVYQAYRPSIGHFAEKHQRFGGDFKLSRMSWIKPNFLWMMYRSGWGRKAGQEIVLAITLKRSFFDEIYRNAIASSFAASGMDNHGDWKTQLATSEVRLQWDPDHGPLGGKLERRAVQLGLRGTVLEYYANNAVKIEDLSGFVESQRDNLTNIYSDLLVPEERIYPIST